MKISDVLINEIVKQAASMSHSQKGDISKYLEEQGFFDEGKMPEALKKRSPQMSGGNPVDVKKEFEKQNP